MLHSLKIVTFSPLEDTKHGSSPLHRVNDHYYGRIDELYCMNNEGLRAPFAIKRKRMGQKSCI